MRVLPWLICIPFALAAAVLPLPSRWAGRVALLAPASVVFLALPLWPQAASGAPSRLPIAWLPSLGINADLRLDRLGALFVLLIGGVGLAVAQYARHYLKNKGHGRFWATLLAFMGSMLGLVLSDSLVLLFVFWELTTITSALLIGMDFEDAAARRGAVQALLVTSGGALALLAGVVLLGQLSGTYNLSELERRGAEITRDPAHTLPLALLLLGAFTKSAQVPFHFWLPGAMTAPAPVSAYLHSATMVKAGVFLLGRLFPVFSASPVWLPALTSVGLATFAVCGWQAMRAWDLKQLLAYSTAAYLGVLTALYGLHARAGAHGEIVAIASHASYKSALFLLAGWLEKATGTRDLRVLRRERWSRIEPIGCALLGAGALALAGAPLLLSFAVKELLFEAARAIGSPGAGPALAVALAGSALSVGYALKLLVGTLRGSEAPPPGRGAPWRTISSWLLLVPAALLAPQLAGGLWPGLVFAALEPDAPRPEGVALWHRADALLALGVLSYALGGAIYSVLQRRAATAAPGAERGARDPIGTAAARALEAAHRVSAALQAGGHPRYVGVILLAATAALGVPLFLRAPPGDAGALVPWPRVSWLPVAMIAAGALLTVWVRHRVAKVLMMAVAGYGTALLYVMFRAPDLALTQILVETVSLVLLLLMFRRLPPLAEEARPRRQRLAHALLAGVMGACAAALAYRAGIHQAADPAGAAHIELSLPEAKGRNVVNVILVDFRGVDTLGEIAVLAMAALSMVALLRGEGPEAGPLDQAPAASPLDQAPASPHDQAPANPGGSPRGGAP